MVNLSVDTGITQGGVVSKSMCKATIDRKQGKEVEEEEQEGVVCRPGVPA